jgi:hypothetical protein
MKSIKSRNYFQNGQKKWKTNNATSSDQFQIWKNYIETEPKSIPTHIYMITHSSGLVPTHIYIHDYSLLWLGTHTHIYTWLLTPLAWYPHTYIHDYSLLWLGTGSIPTHIYTWLPTPLAWYRVDTDTHIYMTTHSSGLVLGRYPHTYIHDYSLLWLGTGSIPTHIYTWLLTPLAWYRHLKPQNCSPRPGSRICEALSIGGRGSQTLRIGGRGSQTLRMRNCPTMDHSM